MTFSAPPSIETLQRRLERAEIAHDVMKQRLDAILEILYSTPSPTPVQFTMSERTTALLLRRASPKLVSKMALYNALYAQKPERSQPEPRILDIWIHRVRQKLHPLGVFIRTEYEQGWVMPSASAEAWDRASVTRDK